MIVLKLIQIYNSVSVMYNIKKNQPLKDFRNHLLMKTGQSKIFRTEP